MRKKLLILGAVVLCAFVWLAVQLFGPSAPASSNSLNASRTLPIAEDGLPNYALAIIEQQREGVTPDNNGARQFWQAIGPMRIDPADFARLCEELEFAYDPAAPVLVDIEARETFRRVSAWLESEEEEHLYAIASSSAEASEFSPHQPQESDEGRYRRNGAIIDILYSVGNTPWTSDQFPPLAKWAAENEEPLDLLVAATAKERFFSPPPNLLLASRTAVVEMLLPHTNAARDAADCLTARAMLRTGEGRYHEAWADCLACWRLGQHIGGGPMLMERLIGIAIRQKARKCTLAILHADGAPAAVGQQILDDLNSLAPRVAISDSLDYAERFQYLDSTLRLFTDRLGGFSHDDFDDIFKLILYIAYDFEVASDVGNTYFDRYVAAAAIEDFRERKAEASRIDADLETVREDLNRRFKGGLLNLNRASRSEALGECLALLMLPAVSQDVKLQAHDEINLMLTRIASALALHHSRHGEYPVALGELTPHILSSIPQDLDGQGPPKYQRRDEGYLLYSVGMNFVDDGGTDWSGEVVNGEWLRPGQEAEQDYYFDNSDIVIRMPRPPMVWPSVAVTPGDGNDALKQPALVESE
jgi:hypothetical protein